MNRGAAAVALGLGLIAIGCGQGERPQSPDKPPAPHPPPSTAPATAPSISASGALPATEKPERPEAVLQTRTKASESLDAFLHSYFQSWSSGEMEAYRAHFHPQARIYVLRAGRIVSAQDLPEFAAEQERLVREAATPMRETLERYEVHEDVAAASVTAEWKLVKGAEVDRGVDRFTIIRGSSGSWQIVALVFYKRE